MKNKSDKLTIISNNDSTSYLLKNQNGLIIELLPTGASISRIEIPYKANESRNIALTFQNISDYSNNSLYLGATLGPSAGRIKNAILPISEKRFTLDANDGPNSLHGGSHNVSFQEWNILTYKDTKDYTSITFGISLPDGLDGYPGNRNIKATYCLDNHNKLFIFYEAISDLATYFNLSNHVYFNLFHDPAKALEQKLYINSNHYISIDKNHLPLKKCPLENTPFDFSRSKTIKSQIELFPKNEQLLHGKGFNHSFILNGDIASPNTSIQNSEDGIGVNIYSDAKCMHFYSGGFINHDYVLENNINTQPSCGIALEPQNVPPISSNENLNYTITQANEIYTRTICYEFIW